MASTDPPTLQPPSVWAHRPNPPPLIYDCVGVSNHTGSLNAGHYTAYCRSPETDLWYEFDDQKVTQIDPAEVSRFLNPVLHCLADAPR